MAVVANAKHDTMRTAITDALEALLLGISTILTPTRVEFP
jgi:hypothetical protein